MSATPAHVTFQAVTKRFSDGPAVLAGIELTVPRGQFVALIGPSGCGKSTLLRLVANLSQPTTGRLTIEGQPPRCGGTDTAFIFQDATLLPWLRVRTNVELPLRLRGRPRDERRREADEMLRRVRLHDVQGRFPRQLSGGMRMRVSVARALVQRPRLLLLDEPFGALDEMTRQHLNEELLELREAQDWTALFVTHSVAEAVFLAQRILIMGAQPGRILADMAVPFEYPRRFDLRERAQFHETVDRVSRRLREVEQERGPDA